jgi:hypothetical protein
MNRQALLLERVPHKKAGEHRRLRAAQWSIGMSICLYADVPRIFQLLTVPEYLETWACFPAGELDAQARVFQSANEYKLDFYCADHLKSTIRGSYLVCRHRKMLFTWSNVGLSSGVSLVEIRLRGNFGSSILELRHTDLASATEYFWQLTMWRASFERLVRLTKNSQLA